MKRIHAIVSGRVQGVFFRDFVEKKAFFYRIKGFVRNMHNGNLEIVAEGEGDHLKMFLHECRKGPELGRVDDVDIKEEEPTGEFEHFSIRY